MRQDGSCLQRAGLASGMRIAAAITTVVAGLSLAVASAAVGAPKDVSGFFPSSESTSSAGGAFDSPRGVAVNYTGSGPADPGDVYVVDGANRRVQVFSSAGVFKFALGRDVIKPGAPGNISNNERQQVTVTGATDGTFVLSLPAVGATQPIAFNASASAVDSALERVGGIGTGNVNVTSVNPGGGSTPGGPYTVEFVGGLADREITQLSGLAGPDATTDTGILYGLTPEGPSTVTVVTLDEGADAAERCTVASDCKAGVQSPGGGRFNNPQGIAVDQSDGSVYVSEQSNRRVQKFTADGSFIRAWGKDVSISDSSGAGETCTAAADCQAGASADAMLARGGEFASTGPRYLAVVPPSAPNAGNVVVTDPGGRRIQEFDADGGFVRAWGFDVVEANADTDFEVCVAASECQAAAAGGADVGQFASGQPTRVAVDSTGAVYAAEPEGNFRVQKFDQGLTAPSIFAAGILSGTSETDAPTDVAIGAGDNVLIARQFVPGSGVPPALVGERRVLELDSSGALQDVHAAGAGLGFADASSTSGVDGIAIDPASGVVYVASSRFTPLVAGQENSVNASRVYMLEPVAPSTGSLGVSSVTAHSALLSGTVNPNGPTNPLGAVRTNYRIEISLDGITWTPIAAAADAGNGTTNVGVSVLAQGLTADTTYQTRMILARPLHMAVVVPAPSFTTPASRPDVEALSPTDRQATSARLSARINPNGSATNYHFEYGPTVGYGKTVPIPDGSAGSALIPAVFTQLVDDLQPETTYHFRVVATNAAGTASSADRTFTTTVSDQRPDGRSFELVSQADKIGGVGVGLWAAGPGHLASSGLAAYTGERFMVGGSYGSPLNGDSAHGYTNDWSFAERAGDQAGWLSHSPITHPNYQPAFAQFLSVHAVSEDLSRSFMSGGNVTPSIFPEMGADSRWNKFNTGYFLDWGAPPQQPSRWELLGPASFDQVSGLVSGDLWHTAIAANGSALVAQPALDSGSPPRAAVFGLAGEGDPTRPVFPDLVAGRSVYLADLSSPVDSFAGTGGHELVNVCTGTDGNRTQLPSATSGGLLNALECPAPQTGRDARLISERGAAIGTPTSDPTLSGVISDNGSRVFFMSPDPRAEGVPDGMTQRCSGIGASTSCPPQLYVRQRNPDGNVKTRWISRAAQELFGRQSSSLTGTVRFEGATPSGDRVFFRTNSPLTPDDPNGLITPPVGGVTTGIPADDSWDLYMYDFPDDPNADLDDGELTRISAGPGTTGDCNSPLPGDPLNQTVAALRFASDDGRRVYFACAAPLPGVLAEAGSSITEPGGSRAAADQTNLYLYDEHQPAQQRWTFIARLPREGSALDVCASSGGSPRSPLVAESGGAGVNLLVGSLTGAGSNCFGGTSDGAFVTFFTPGRLTADDPSGPVTGDIYAYDAAAGELARITRAQGGAGGTYLCAPGKLNSPAATDTALCHGDGGVDHHSGRSTGQGGVLNPGLGVVTDPESAGDRVAFFESKSRLVADDLDDGYDVYRWRNGELTLITSGAADSTDALYKGNDRDGRNVFFVTRDRLTWQDYDDVADIYTARVDGGIAPPDRPPPCDALAGACQTGGADPLPVPGTNTSAPIADENRSSDRRVLTVAGVGAKARARAARTGVLSVRVRASHPGLVTATARAKIGLGTVKVSTARKRLARAGQATLKLRLSKRARAVLRAGRVLPLTLEVAQPGAAKRTATVRLERGSKS